MSRLRARGRPALTLLVAGAAVAAGAGAVRAQSTIVAYDYTGLPGNQTTTPASSVATGVSATDIARSSDLVPSLAANTMSANNWPTSLTLTDPTLGFYTFTLTPSSGFALNLSQLQIPLQSSGGGPDQVVVRSSLDGFTTDIGPPFMPLNNTLSTDTIDLTAATFQNLTSPIEFHVYGYFANNGPNGQLRFFPSTVVTGSVAPTPEPALTLSAAAAATGLAWLYRGIRRRRSVA
ncbi:MAG TPA: hypothetical protein VGF55_06060 [Gemmataceae bacterium]|jgi:hypothetical protein